MEVRILGPFEVRVDGRVVELGGPKPRALLAVLALHANESVSAERVALALWGDDSPSRAVKTVQIYVARLRKALGDPGVLVAAPGGYYLRVQPGELDAERFERRVADGRQGVGGRTKRRGSRGTAGGARAVAGLTARGVQLGAVCTG